MDKFKPFEQIAQDGICSLFNTEILNVCCNKFYDFETTQNIKYEVKTDVKCLITGNYYIEFFGYGGNSRVFFQGSSRSEAMGAHIRNTRR